MHSGDEVLRTDILLSTLEHQAVGVAILKPLDGGEDFFYVFVNPAYQALKPHVPMPGRTYTEVWPEGPRRHIEARRRVIATGEPWNEQDLPVDLERAPGLMVTEYLALHNARLDVEGGPYLLSEVRITTAEVAVRQRAERELETTRLLLQVSQALTKPVELGQVLRELAEVLLGSTSHTRSFVFLWDEDRRVLTQAASAGVDAFPHGQTFSFDSVSVLTQKSITERRTEVVDFDALPEPQRGGALAAQRSHILISVPVVWQDRLVAMIGVDDPGERREPTDREIEIIEGIAAQAAVAIENARLFEELAGSLRELKEKDRAIREAYSDVIDAVTGGRLIILGRDEMSKAVCAADGASYEVQEPAALAEARERLRRTLGDVPKIDDLVLAFSEAATNMLKHAGGGRYRIGKDAKRVQIVLSDHGPGIDFRDLPKATLVPGFSTKQTLGMGFSIMMELTDRLLLCSDSGGTTLVLEKDL